MFRRRKNQKYLKIRLRFFTTENETSSIRLQMSLLSLLITESDDFLMKLKSIFLYRRFDGSFRFTIS